MFELWPLDIHRSGSMMSTGHIDTIKCRFNSSDCPVDMLLLSPVRNLINLCTVFNFRRLVRHVVTYAQHLSGVCAQPLLQSEGEINEAIEINTYIDGYVLPQET